MSEDYYSVLARTMAAMRQDHALMRAMIYRVARSELKRHLTDKYADVGLAGIARQIAALEAAIEDIESDCTDGKMLPTFSPGGGESQNATEESKNATLSFRHNASKPAVTRDADGEILSPVLYSPPRTILHTQPLPALTHPEAGFAAGPVIKPIRAVFPSTLQLTVAAVLGVALYTAVEAHGDLRTMMPWHGHDGVIPGQQVAHEHSSSSAGQLARQENDAEQSSTLNLGSQLGSVPIPSSYGVYAVNNRKLIDLQSLPIRVPDQRVQISGLISNPSERTLPDGRVAFIAFRRDLVNNAPDRVTVRVIARVMQALTFDVKGKARLIHVDGSWAVRSNAYEMKVAPVSGHPEMILIRPENADFIFPAGRYALVMPGLSYDFSVKGPITDAAQCLERTDAVDMPVYSECRNP